MNTRVSIVTSMFACMVLLLWLYPNLIHEPLHLLALKLQGLQGTINFDWSFPAHPSTVAVVKPSGVAGALFYQLLPSIVSVVLLVISAITRARATVWTHFVLPAYLGFDLLINVMSYSLPTSDFRVLQIFPLAELAVAAAVLGLTTYVVLGSRIAVLKKLNLEVKV
ncbi:hypothetical protein GOV11_00785 [Candidatus Woesearchaeota archaeon]|nr:hypothetical protein [Candidatus Woesearchaeota archaeon]